MTSLIEFLLNVRNDFLKSNKEETKITIMNATEAMYGDDGTCDTKWCDEHNIPYYLNKLLKNTGCIIAVKGNILLDIKRKLELDGVCFADKFSKALCEYLKNKNLLSIRCDNNDVLVDGFKVASSAEVTLPTGLEYLCYQISINLDMDAIKHACTKPMVKVPKGLGEYGITTEEMVKFCEDYWTKH